MRNKEKIARVYSIIVLLVYAWTFITFFYKLPSWVNYLTLQEIGVVLAYSLSVDLLESLFVLGEILLLYFLLSKLVPEADLPVQGTWLAVTYLGTLMLYFLPAFEAMHAAFSPGMWILVSVIAAAILTLVVSRWNIPRSLALFLSERATVFLWIFPPLSVISLLVIVVRFLF